MTNRERVNAILAWCALFQRLASEAKRASRSKRPFVHIKIVGANVFLGLPT